MTAGRSGWPNCSRPVAVLGAALVLLLTAGSAVSGCSDSGGKDQSTTTTAGPQSTTTAGGISEQEAIDIAREKVQTDDPEFDASATRPVAIPDRGTYDVGFPEKNPVGPGGEPHVVVDRETGEVVDTYQTR